MSALLKIGGLSKNFGGFAALTDVSLEVGQGERFGLIGPNGSGKTTLINCVSGLLRNDAGSIVFNGEEVSRLPAYRRTRRGIARSFQVPRPFHTMTVLENLLVPSAYVVHMKDADGEARAMELLKTRAVVRPEVKRVLDRLEKVPVDIAPRFVTAAALSAVK